MSVLSSPKAMLLSCELPIRHYFLTIAAGNGMRLVNKIFSSTFGNNQLPSLLTYS